MLESVPVTNQYRETRVKFLTQRNNIGLGESFSLISLLKQLFKFIEKMPLVTNV